MIRRQAYVGYYVDDSGVHEETTIDAEETDDAEVEAILFAIDKLADKAKHISIVCDHQSVVSEATRDTVGRKPSERLDQLRKVLDERKPNIELEAIQYNLAHGTLSEFVRRQSSISPD